MHHNVFMSNLAQNSSRQEIGDSLEIIWSFYTLHYFAIIFQMKLIRKNALYRIAQT